ncbi:MAG: GNAT family N-acetyltransferase [Ruminococcaceae bacterium]|nr:GNAT family N-acetyltransferase [Oscillospiraceae bacterium]
MDIIFDWKDYSEKYSEITEALLDETAIKNTGCDEGFHTFYSYWLEEEYTKLNKNFWCKLAFKGDELIGVICLGLSPTDEFTIMEIIVTPNIRNQGYGSKMLLELLKNAYNIIGVEITLAKAVVFPNNIASQKAFEKAGFVFTGAHPDGDALYYEYMK